MHILGNLITVAVLMLALSVVVDALWSNAAKILGALAGQISSQELSFEQKDMLTIRPVNPGPRMGTQRPANSNISPVPFLPLAA
jgi:hypothetical protein